MIRRARTIIVASVFLLGTVGLPSSQRAFSNVDIGSEVKNMVMPTLAGDQRGFMGDDEDVHLFFFFKPDQESSLTFMRDIEALRRDLKERSIYWSAIVSDRFAKEKISSVVAETGLTAPVLLDHDDQLFGYLGVALHPVVGITDRDHVLRVYLHFRKVNFIQLVRAHVLHLLGDISEEELARVLEPKAAVQGGESVAAERLLKLAQMLFKAGKIEMALKRTNESIEKNPSFVPAHLLLAKILLAENNKQAASEAFRKALEIDPGNEEAKQGLQSCEE